MAQRHPWTLDELSARVRAALESSGLDHQRNGQVSEVPNARTIRYYATIGLIDRPQLFGRTAMYGARHLEQIVAIKRLQLEGLPLASIQERLDKLDDAALQTLAALPDVATATLQMRAGDVADSVGDAGEVGPVQKSEPSRRERAFWGSAPEPVPAPAAPAAKAKLPPTTPATLPKSELEDVAHLLTTYVGASSPRAAQLTVEPVAPVADHVPVTGITTSDGVTLCFPTAGPVDDDDREALRAALQPVVELLRARGLLTPEPGRKEDEP